MIIDCHMHTMKYSGCSRIRPEALCEKALRRNLKGIVITEHHVQWSAIELEILKEKFPDLALYSGVEITVREGFDIVLITKEMGWTFNFLTPFDELLEQISRIQDDTFCFIAHSFRWMSFLTDELEYILEHVDGIEMNSINILKGNSKKHNTRFVPLNEELYTGACHRFNLVPLFNSDAHSMEAVGILGNRFQGIDLPGDGGELASMLHRHVPQEYQNAEILSRFFL